jgi:hypothetical protein
VGRVGLVVAVGGAGAAFGVRVAVSRAIREDWIARDQAQKTHRVVFTDFDLSMMVSVPTSRRPTSVGAMLYFSSRFCTPGLVPRINLERSSGNKPRLQSYRLNLCLRDHCRKPYFVVLSQS